MDMYGINKNGLRKRKIHGEAFGPSTGTGKAGSRPFNNGDNLVSMKSNDMTKHVLNRIHYFENLQKQIDAHTTKAESIALRKTWLDKQKKINYTNEYDRLRSQVAQNVVKGASVDSLLERQNVLKRLGVQSLDGIH